MSHTVLEPSREGSTPWQLYVPTIWGGNGGIVAGADPISGAEYSSIFAAADALGKGESPDLSRSLIDSRR